MSDQHYTPQSHLPAPYWRCHDVYGAPGDAACWMCPNTTPEANGPSLHTSTGEVLVGEHDLADQLPEVPTLIERTADAR